MELPSFFMSFIFALGLMHLEWGVGWIFKKKNSGVFSVEVFAIFASGEVKALFPT